MSHTALKAIFQDAGSARVQDEALGVKRSPTTPGYDIVELSR
jgi:hypothetical protein